MSQRSIEDFKAVLQGGGVRPTMFEVELTFPESVVADSTEITRDGTFLVQAAQLPASNVGTIEVPFRGRKLKVSGDRTFANWNATIINDDSFMIKNAMEKWSEKIQNHNFALGSTVLNDYFSDAYVRQLDRDASVLRTYAFRGIWPVNISEVALNFGENDTYEKYDVEFAVQYWTATNAEEPVEAQNDEFQAPDTSQPSIIDS